MWYKESQSTITVYHGTDEEGLLQIRSSGFLQRTGVPNLTTNKDYAIAYAQKYGFGRLFVLTLVVPKNLLDSTGNSLYISSWEDLDQKYIKKVENITVDIKKRKLKDLAEVEKSFVEEKGRTMPKPSDYEERVQEKIRELEKNPFAYVPAWMRNDNRLKGKF